MLSKRGIKPKKDYLVMIINLSSNQRLFPLILLTFLLSRCLVFCIAKDTITFESSLSDDETKDSVVSKGKVFELGFFSPNGSSDNRRYVGIWYYRSKPETVVWVANRDSPVSGSGGVLSISKDGNLRVSDKSGKIHWSTNTNTNTNVDGSSGTEAAELADSGNLVLRSSSGVNVWQSFENPADTFLPGMRLDENLSLISWRRRDDPGPGNFTFQQDQEKRNEVIILRRSAKYWNSGVSGRFMSIDELPPAILFLLNNFSSKYVNNDSVPHLTPSLYRYFPSFSIQIKSSF